MNITTIVATLILLNPVATQTSECPIIQTSGCLDTSEQKRASDDRVDKLSEKLIRINSFLKSFGKRPAKSGTDPQLERALHDQKVVLQEIDALRDLPARRDLTRSFLEKK